MSEAQSLASSLKRKFDELIDPTSGLDWSFLVDLPQGIALQQELQAAQDRLYEEWRKALLHSKPSKGSDPLEKYIEASRTLASISARMQGKDEARPRSSGVDEHYAQAARLIEGGHYEEALALLAKVKADNPFKRLQKARTKLRPRSWLPLWLALGTLLLCTSIAIGLLNLFDIDPTSIAQAQAPVVPTVQPSPEPTAMPQPTATVKPTQAPEPTATPTPKLEELAFTIGFEEGATPEPIHLLSSIYMDPRFQSLIKEKIESLYFDDKGDVTTTTSLIVMPVKLSLQTPFEAGYTIQVQKQLWSELSTKEPTFVTNPTDPEPKPIDITDVNQEVEIWLIGGDMDFAEQTYQFIYLPEKDMFAWMKLGS